MLKAAIFKIVLFSPMMLLAFCSVHSGRDIKIHESNNDGRKTYAKRYVIEQKEGYSQIKIINPWQGAGGVVQNWYLVKSGTMIPPGIDTNFVIKVPVKKIICMSTTHLAMINALHEAESIKGFSGTRYIYDDGIRRMADAGLIHDVGYEEYLNKEMILRIAPDLIIAYGIGSESQGYTGKLRELGLKIMIDADYLENDPLGKAEWIRVIGALYCREKLADSVFSDIERKYIQAKNYIKANARENPYVLLGLPFRDTWYVSPGNSYISRLIEDAGGRYLWRNTESSFSMPMSLETVYTKAVKADYWLNIAGITSKEEITSLDPRFSSLQAFENGNLFSNGKRTNTGGGNDYWEGGCINPQVILMDIAEILHPYIYPGRQLYYYSRIN